MTETTTNSRITRNWCICYVLSIDKLCEVIYSNKPIDFFENQRSDLPSIDSRHHIMGCSPKSPEWWETEKGGEKSSHPVLDCFAIYLTIQYHLYKSQSNFTQWFSNEVQLMRTHLIYTSTNLWLQWWFGSYSHFPLRMLWGVELISFCLIQVHSRIV